MHNQHDKQPPRDRFTRWVSRAVIGVFLLLLLTPAALLLVNGEDQTVMEGELRHTAPDFSLSGFLTASYQADFEDWFSTRYPMRGQIVSAYRQLQFRTDNMRFQVGKLLNREPSAETPAETVPEETLAEGYSDFNVLYSSMNERLYHREAVELSSYRGTEQVVIGKSGYCYENGYINEYYGYSPKYRECSDEFLAERAQILSEIQQMLAQRGIAFTLIISPSKASEYARFIPDWYKAQNTPVEGYVRPVTRLLPMLAEREVNVIDCAAYFDEIGLDETFPLTGIHWNKPAAYEATRALIEAYEEQSGLTRRNIQAYSLAASRRTPGFGNSETDIFGVAYSGLPEDAAIRDDYYYWPDLALENEYSGNVDILIQGGSFCWDFKYYMETYGLCGNFRQFYYNEWQEDDWTDPRLMGEDAWEAILDSVDYVVMECNEQYVCMMGTEPPRWGAADREPLGDDRWDVYESLHRYLCSSAS